MSQDYNREVTFKIAPATHTEHLALEELLGRLEREYQRKGGSGVSLEQFATMVNNIKSELQAGSFK
jgi:hypothetical protein